MYRVDPAYKSASEWNCKYTHIQTILLYVPSPTSSSLFMEKYMCTRYTIMFNLHHWRGFDSIQPGAGRSLYKIK